MTAVTNYSMQEVHYCRLEAQSNVYGLAQFESSANENRLLVASIHGKVMSVSFQKTVPSSREVNFTYIPGMHMVAFCFVLMCHCGFYLGHIKNSQCNVILHCALFLSVCAAKERFTVDF